LGLTQQAINRRNEQKFSKLTLPFLGLDLYLFLSHQSYPLDLGQEQGRMDRSEAEEALEETDLHVVASRESPQKRGDLVRQEILLPLSHLPRETDPRSEIQY
jgi:hypothetical protein